VDCRRRYYPWYTSNKELGHGVDHVWHVASMKPIIVMGINIDEIQRRIVEMVVIAHRSCCIMKHKCVGFSKLDDHGKPPLACRPCPCYRNMLGLLQVPFKFEARSEFATYITFVNMVFHKISCLTSACIYKQYQS
jgi:hypothetical protein